jgi:integrase
MTRSKSFFKNLRMLKPPPPSPGLKRHIERILTTSKRPQTKSRIAITHPAGKPRPSIQNPSPIGRTDDAKIFRKLAFDKLKFAIDNSYADATSANHSYAIKRFLNFAAKCGVDKEHALPCKPDTLCLWIADGVGRTGVGTATANIAALSAWHRSRGLPFEIPLEIKTIKRALKLHWPEEKQQKPPRPPISPKMVRLLAEAWSKKSPKMRCALAIALAAFIGQMRLGELLPASLEKLDRKNLPSRAQWSPQSESRGSSTISLPWTKTTGKAGALVTLPLQAAPLDPTRAICHHLVASDLDDSALLCEYREKGKVEMMDKVQFMAMCNQIWCSHGFQRITGHSFRIGGTTSLLLSGVDVEIVKRMGRWSSDAFKLYWRKVEVLFTKHASDVSWVDFDI